MVAYRLCDRDFDCEHCPLDRALQGRALPPRPRTPQCEEDSVAIAFPADRFYFRNHFWLLESPSPARFGLDAFGAHLLGSISAIRGRQGASYVERSDPLVELDLGPGNLVLRSPLHGLVHRINPDLQERPGLVLSECYHGGWIAELTTQSKAGSRAEELIDYREIERCAGHALRRFRRRIAHHLLADDLGVGPTLADGGVPVNDLRLLLGFPRFLELLEEFLG